MCLPPIPPGSRKLICLSVISSVSWWRSNTLESRDNMLDLQTIDGHWTLFLDRDGVINEEKEQSYVFHYDEFAFYEGSLEALRLLADIFPRIVVVTIQRGVGKGLMTGEDLADIHGKMAAEVAAAGGRIDAIYYCDSLSDDHPYRKPNPGMALAAQHDLPGIDFSRSIMVRNNISDMEFGRNARIYTVFLSTTSPEPELAHPAIDLAV